MRIIDSECRACAAFNKCSVSVAKGSLICIINRSTTNQTKEDMWNKVRQEKEDREEEMD